MFEAPVNSVYVAKENFSAVVNGSIRKFSAGEPVIQQYLVDELLKGGCPIDRIDTAEDVHVCPSCGHKYLE